MKNVFSLLVACALAVTILTPMTANAQASDNHTVTVTVQPISVLTVGADVNIVVSAAAAGQEPTPVEGTSSWSLTTNAVGPMKVTASTDLAMPTGLTLGTRLTAPAGASSPGAFVPLGTADSDVVTGISQVTGQNLLMTYEAVATVAAATGNPAFVVTYTLTTE